MALRCIGPIITVEFTLGQASSPFLSKMTITEGMLKCFSNRFDVATSFYRGKTEALMY